VRFQSSWHHSFRFGVNGIHQKSAAHAYLEDIGRKDQGWGLLDEGSAPPMPDDDGPAVTGAMALAVDKGDGTYCNALIFENNRIL
jgi:hypothetical protein